MKTILRYIPVIIGMILMAVSCMQEEESYDFGNPDVKISSPSWLKAELVVSNCGIDTVSGEIVLSGFRNGKGCLTINRVGFCYSVDSVPTPETDAHIDDTNYYCFSHQGEKDNSNEFFTYKKSTGEVTGRYPYSQDAIRLPWQIGKVKLGTKYFCRTYVENVVGREYGDIVEFETPDTTTMFWKVGSAVVVSECETTPSKISVPVKFEFKQGATVGDLLSYGICYSTEGEPTIAVNMTEGKSADGKTFTIELEKLDYGTTYYIRPYVMCEGKALYGKTVEVSTKNIGHEIDITETCAHTEDVVVTAAFELEDCRVSDIVGYGIAYGNNKQEAEGLGHYIIGNGATDYSKKFSVTIPEMERGQSICIVPFIITEGKLTASGEMEGCRVVFGTSKVVKTISLEVVASEQTKFDASETGFEVNGVVSTYVDAQGNEVPYPYRYTYRVDLEFYNIEDAKEIGWDSEYEVAGKKKVTQWKTDEFREGKHEEHMWQFANTLESEITMRAYAVMKDGTKVQGKNEIVLKLKGEGNKSQVLVREARQERKK